MRVALQATHRVGDLNRLQHRLRAATGRLWRSVLLNLEDLGHLPLDRQIRVQRGHWILKDHRNPVATDPVQLVRRQAQQIASFEVRRASCVAASGQQSEDCKHALALPRATLADDPKRLPFG